MSPRAAIIFNAPEKDRYTALGEQKAVKGVLVEVKAVHDALEKLGYTVEKVSLLSPLEKAREIIAQLKTDVVFNLFEGFAGRPETEATVAGILAQVGFSYTGCAAPALELALDKAKAKTILQKFGIPTPDFQVLVPENINQFRLKLPCIVKPAAEDASHGVTEQSIVNDLTSLEVQVRFVTESYGKALIEEFIDGREFNVTVMGNNQPEVFPISEIVYTLPEGYPRILTFEAKWEPDSLYFKSSMPVCPAQIDESIRHQINNAASAAFKALGCSGYARVDFRMGNDGVPQVIEVNPNPDLSPGYGVALQSRVAGMSYARMIEKIIRLAMERVNAN